MTLPRISYLVLISVLCNIVYGTAFLRANEAGLPTDTTPRAAEEKLREFGIGIKELPLGNGISENTGL